jgi:hypothetical protein
MSGETGEAQTVNKAGTTTALVSSVNPSVTGQAVTFTATVAASGSGSGTPTGNAEFFDGGTAIAACGGSAGNPVNGSGVATCTVTYTGAGNHTITAQYLGDSNYNASAVSSSITQSVNIFAANDWTNSAPSGATFTCNYASVTAVTCSLSGLGTGGATVTGSVRLIDASHNAVTNTTGADISVTYSLSGSASGLTPSSPASIANGSSTTPSISFNIDHGNGKTATLARSDGDAQRRYLHSDANRDLLVPDRANDPRARRNTAHAKPRTNGCEASECMSRGAPLVPARALSLHGRRRKSRMSVAGWLGLREVTVRVPRTLL